MKYSYFASVAVRVVEKVPSLVWAAWILGVVVGTGFLALHIQPIG